MNHWWDRQNYGGGMGTYMRHSGRGPRGFQRSDDRILEEVCERLTWDPDLDASEIEVRVENGVVMLEGMVESRHDKRRAEDLADEVRGVMDVQNRLRTVSIQQRAGGPDQQRGTGSDQQSATGLSGMAATPVIGPGAAGLTGVGDGTTALSGGSFAGVANMPSHNNPGPNNPERP
jgi:hypothetical protein